MYQCGPEHMEVEMYYAPSSVRRARGARTGIATSEEKQERNERESVKKLVSTVRNLNKESFELELDTKYLYYQRFTNMNCYENVLKLVQ